jgi:hypothetical protein
MAEADLLNPLAGKMSSRLASIIRSKVLSNLIDEGEVRKN